VGERFKTRALAVSHALLRRPWRGKGGAGVRRVLVAHNLLLGDTMMLTPLLAKLAANHPGAEVTLLAAPAIVPLYATRPFGVRALPFAPGDAATTRALLREEPFDLAVVVGDNRYSWLAAALRARRIVAHAGDAPWTKEVLIDELRPYSAEPTAWSEMVSNLIDGVEPPAYARGDWTAPDARDFEIPASPYAVLHVGASTPLKHWLPQRWLALARHLEERGLHVVWSAGRGEEAIVAACDPEGRYPSYAGRLDLPQVWRLLSRAQLLVAPDTGVAHMGRATFTPTVTLYGPGSAVLCAPGQFWRDVPQRALTIDPFECRDQPILFRRRVAWVRRCFRSPSECAEPRCMHAIDLSAVIAAADELGAGVAG
jgi:ADP-heptose:LPS heptosyltransferase